MHKDQAFIDKVWRKVQHLEQIKAQQEQKKKKVLSIAGFFFGVLLVVMLLIVTDSFSTVPLFVLGGIMMSFSIYYEYAFSKGDEHVL